MNESREQVDVPPGWGKTFSRLCEEPGVVMVIGAVDTGKSALCRALARHAIQVGSASAVVDADVGQSSIGPPTTIAWAPAELLGDDGRWRGWRDFYFVGATSPYGHMLGCAAGTRAMADEAREHPLVIVDTTGMVHSGVGAALKHAKVDLLRPRHIIGIQHSDEIEHILRPLEGRLSLSVHRLRPSRRVVMRDREERRRRRLAAYAEHFAGGDVISLALRDVRLVRTPLGGGPVAPAHVRAFAEAKLGVTVLHVEMTSSLCTLVVEGEPSAEAAGSLRADMEADEVCMVRASSLPGTLLALADAEGRNLCLGILESVDFRHGSLAVFAPPVDASQCRLVVFGDTRLSRADFGEPERANH